MPNKFYEKGRRFENAIANKFKKHGVYVMRSAKSEGVFDLIAVSKGKVYGIQCKYDGRIHKSEVEKIMSVARMHNIIAILAFSKNRKHYFAFLDSGRVMLANDFIKSISVV